MLKTRYCSWVELRTKSVHNVVQKNLATNVELKGMKDKGNTLLRPTETAGARGQNVP